MFLVFNGTRNSHANELGGVIGYVQYKPRQIRTSTYYVNRVLVRCPCVYGGCYWIESASIHALLNVNEVLGNWAAGCLSMTIKYKSTASI